ncbi:MAG: hypothetical protein ACLU4N_05595 [Butyricimonas faecihominis]
MNKKGQEMCEFASSFDRLLITDECSLDSLKCSFETKVEELNKKYPKTKLSLSVVDTWMHMAGNLVSKLDTMIVNRFVLFRFRRFVDIILLVKVVLK